MDWRTKLLNPTQIARQDYNSLVTPVYRGSTVVFDDQSSIKDDWQQSEKGYSYGLYGTPTTLELAARISQIEDARHTFIVPGGQSAIALVYFAYCKSGSHALVPYSAYGPNKAMAEGLMKGLGVEVEAYDPMIGKDIKKLIRKNTTLIWCESPGSVTMEIQDIPEIVKVAHQKNVPVALDNTYAAGVLFDAFKFNVDISIQALTKYVGGHSDLLLGSVSVRDENAYKTVGPIYMQLGLAVSPDDCSLALRGLQTLALRLDQLEKSTLEVALWLSKNDMIDEVYHPALDTCPGHDIWKRDFTGSASVFSFTFIETISSKEVQEFINSLNIFKIGLSWGGVTSLAVVYPGLDRPNKDFGGRLVRLNIGLEAVNDLINDLDEAISTIRL
ncbi:cystathionine beta-lyase [Amylibacter sp.]|nr:cystathionine beta-lyase [Amylibacter sp.]MDB9992388.1 cystathionine beta-lyase [Amylibacter sp.]